MKTELETLQSWLDGSDDIVFFGGAGVSTESGIPDFRSVDGLYNQSYRYPPETIISHSFFERDPEEFYRFYKDRMLYLDAAPNAAHRKLAELERAGLIKCVVTQNADDLHRRAGSRRVIDIHGNVYINTCPGCGKRFPPEVVADCEGVPRCDVCGGVIRPGILLFGEVPDMRLILEAIREINRADLLLIGGTSLKVSSAPRLLDRFRGRMVIINDEPTPFDGRAELVIRGRAAPAFELILYELAKGEKDCYAKD